MGDAVPLILSRPVPPALRGSVRRVIGYGEAGTGLQAMEPADLVVPLVIGFGTPFRIGLGSAAANQLGSFVGGLVPAPVRIGSDGAAACIQIDLSPLGAFRLLGPAVRHVAGRVVPLSDLPGLTGLAERLGNAGGWQERFTLVEGFLARSLALGPAPSRLVRTVWARLEASGGKAGVAALAEEAGVSRKTLSARFREETGLPPKPVARLIRFRAALALARAGGNWADVAAEAGYADQPHLSREFAELAGASPERWRAALG